ncbi:MAG: hypothetical protein EPN17_08510 [Methylobacter sp.]|nr:MAG: hypothetical protein EPN17_08510 [Methylobacter sp.]
MSEFNNRISAQREILSIVNSIDWHEELLGLSSGSLGRWTQSNQIDINSMLFCLIRKTADKLFFLANKSQEQITEDYKSLSAEVTELTRALKAELDLYAFNNS